MRRRDLLRVILAHAAENDLEVTIIEGSRHTKVVVGDRRTVLPRHREINEQTAASILKQIGLRS